MKLTIITALLNSDPLVLKTRDSLLPQLHPGKVEWLVKDSGHSDDLMKLLGVCNGVTYFSKPDLSPYEGMNQALELVDDGFFMNNGAGDIFIPGSLELIRSRINQNASEKIFFFSVSYNGSFENRIIPRPKEIGHRMAVPNPGAVFDVDLVRKLGGFDQSYKIAADYDLICRALKNFRRCYAEDVVVSDFMPGGISERHRTEGALEKKLIQIRVWGSRA